MTNSYRLACFEIDEFYSLSPFSTAAHLRSLLSLLRFVGRLRSQGLALTTNCPRSSCSLFPQWKVGSKSTRAEGRGGCAVSQSPGKWELPPDTRVTPFLRARLAHLTTSYQTPSPTSLHWQLSFQHRKFEEHFKPQHLIFKNAFEEDTMLEFSSNPCSAISLCGVTVEAQCSGTSTYKLSSFMRAVCNSSGL